MTTPELDIIIPVYNEGANITDSLDALAGSVKTPFRILICYDHDDDDTLPVVRAYQAAFDIELIKNSGVGAHGAVLSGFRASTAPAVLVFPADDDYNAGIIDGMMEKFREGCDVACACRFMPGGRMEGCPWLKSTLIRMAAWSLHHLARLPARDPSHGFRLFSRRVLDNIEIESTEGFTYSIELLMKCHRRGWKIGEVPALWLERTKGQSRFRVLQWLPAYLKWYFYAYSTTYLRKGART